MSDPQLKVAPVYTETVTTTFPTDGMDAMQIAHKYDEMLTDLRKQAGDAVRSYFLKRGYCNASIGQHISHKDTEIECSVSVYFWGLPEIGGATGE